MVCPIIFLFSFQVMSRSGFSLINRSSVVPRVNPMPVRYCFFVLKDDGHSGLCIRSFT